MGKLSRRDLFKAAAGMGLGVALPGAGQAAQGGTQGGQGGGEPTDLVFVNGVNGVNNASRLGHRHRLRNV
jgi:hypothetical protein